MRILMENWELILGDRWAHPGGGIYRQAGPPLSLLSISLSSSPGDGCTNEHTCQNLSNPTLEI